MGIGYSGGMGQGPRGPQGHSGIGIGLNVRVYGALGDGTTDDTAAIQAGLDDVASRHERLYFPVGTYKITDTLRVVQRSNFGVCGPTKQGGTYNARILWAGVQGGTMLLLDGVRETEWSDIAVDGGSAGSEPAIIVDIDKVTAGGTISRKNSFRRMLLRGGSTATVRIANTSTTNNEAHVFEDVINGSIASKVGFGYQVKNINAKGIQVVRGEINGKTAAVRIEGGSIHLHSVEISGCVTWVSKSGSGESLVISNCDGDSSQRFLELLPGQIGPVYGTGNRFVQSTDGDILTFTNNAGPVVLIGNDFASGGYRPGATTTITSNGPRMVAIGNVFPNDTMLPYPLGSAPTRFSGLYSLSNQFYGEGNQLNPMDDSLVPHRSAGGSYSSLRFGGATGWLAEANPITTPTAQFVAHSATVTFSALADYTLTSVPTFAVGDFDGQVLTLLNVGTKTVTLQDRGTLAGSGIALTAATVAIGPRQSLSLTWSATLSLWIQTGPLVAPL